MCTDKRTLVEKEVITSYQTQVIEFDRSVIEIKAGVVIDSEH